MPNDLDRDPRISLISVARGKAATDFSEGWSAILSRWRTSTSTSTSTAVTVMTHVCQLIHIEIRTSSVCVPREVRTRRSFSRAPIVVVGSSYAREVVRTRALHGIYQEILFYSAITFIAILPSRAQHGATGKRIKRRSSDNVNNERWDVRCIVTRWMYQEMVFFQHICVKLTERSF